MAYFPCFSSTKSNHSECHLLASCIHSKWGDAALTVFVLGALAVGIFASAQGPACGGGGVNAALLSHVMYGLAIFFSIILIVKCALAYYSKRLP